MGALLNVCNSGDHIVASDTLYGALHWPPYWPQLVSHCHTGMNLGTSLNLGTSHLYYSAADVIAYLLVTQDVYVNAKLLMPTGSTMRLFLLLLHCIKQDP